MSLILSIETSTDVCSVALHDEGHLIEETVIQEPQAHAARLAPLIDDLFHSTNQKFSNLKAVAVSSGPGSYTGLRIGTSTAKGICYALNIPLIAVPTLTLIAVAARDKGAVGLICPMIDARRMEVYCAVYNHDLSIQAPVQALVIDENAFRELLESEKVFFCGNGASKVKGVLSHPNAVFIENVLPSAQVLGVLADEKYAHQAFEDLVSFAPFYLKEFEAKKARSLI